MLKLEHVGRRTGLRQHDAVGACLDRRRDVVGEARVRRGIGSNPNRPRANSRTVAEKLGRQLARPILARRVDGILEVDDQRVGVDELRPRELALAVARHEQHRAQQ